ncbi:MAG TPA: DUF881 domain-containing protein [Micromonosporaceae bacterium]|nr:DUF881 domain-containing protein [Micromonosporaceae bacterium]
MADEHQPTGTGWPEPPLPATEPPVAEPPVAEPAVTELPVAEPAVAAGTEAGALVAGPPDAGDTPDTEGAADAAGTSEPPVRRRLSAAGAVIGLLLGLLGFTLVMQLRSNAADPELASARPEDLVRILSDLEAREERLRREISDLEESQRQLASGARGRQAALEEARRRADELGILAGTLPAQGPGLAVRFMPGAGKPVEAAALLDAVEELRGAGAEAMQVTGADGGTVRVVASTAFVDADGGLLVGGRRLSAPYTVTVIGDPQTMRTALNIPGGVVESIGQDGGSVILDEPGLVAVTALHEQGELRYARPVP